MAAIDRYNENLTNPQAPGNGCHSWIMSTANLGVIGSVDPQQIQTDIRRVIPTGTRAIRDKEINDAINKAMMDHSKGTFTPRPQPKPIINNGKDTRQQIINQSQTSDEADLYELSHIRLDYEPKDDAIHFLPVLFEPGDLLFIGDRLEAGIMGENIRVCSDWINFFKAGGTAGPFIIINSLSGQPAQKKDGTGDTYRGDGNVKTFKYCLVEFDDLSREDQIRFWTAAKLPIKALVDTGGKSIHAWIEVSKLAMVNSLDDWNVHIKRRLYEQILRPLGVDAACSNPARLSRMPGWLRDTGNYQRILWLSHEGESINV